MYNSKKVIIIFLFSMIISLILKRTRVNYMCAQFMTHITRNISNIYKKAISTYLFYLILKAFGHATFYVEKDDDLCLVSCGVNGVPLTFIFYTGAGDDLISSFGALFCKRTVV